MVSVPLTEGKNEIFARSSPVEISFFPLPGSLQNQIHILLVLQKIKALPEGGQQLNSKYNTDQGRVLIHRQIWIPYLIELRNKVTTDFYWNKASLTTVHDP